MRTPLFISKCWPYRCNRKIRLPDTKRVRNIWKVLVVKPEWKLQVADLGLGGGTLRNLNMKKLEVFVYCNAVLSVKLWGLCCR